MEPSQEQNSLPTVANAIKLRRRRRGKIARLPRHLREQVNVMLDDGVPHAEIIQRLGDHGRGLNKFNLIRWQKGGHQDWLKDQPWLDELHSRLDFADNIVTDPDSPKVREASLIIAVKQMYELITSFEPVSFREQLAADPSTYSRIMNSLAKLAEVGLRYDRERHETSRSTAREKDKAMRATGLTTDMLCSYENEFKLLRRRRKPLAPSTAPDQVQLSASVGLPGADSGEPKCSQVQSSAVKCT